MSTKLTITNTKKIYGCHDIFGTVYILKHTKIKIKSFSIRRLQKTKNVKGDAYLVLHSPCDLLSLSKLSFRSETAADT